MFHKFKITTCAFILCLFGLTLMTVSPVFATDSAAFKQCQQIKPQGKFEPMKQKKNCFKDLAGPRSSAEFGECRKIKPRRQFLPMKQKKNCFRDLAQSLQAGGQTQTPAKAQAPSLANAQSPAERDATIEEQRRTPKHEREGWTLQRLWDVRTMDHFRCMNRNMQPLAHNWKKDKIAEQLKDCTRISDAGNYECNSMNSRNECVEYGDASEYLNFDPNR
jgi:hypothetical protein